ncbi:MAG: hypothetical protein JAY99_10515 [Candidatus Thiodiazotropha lotti]|nr:hypothetical protein [Candidatus Thiodiazotropha endoloripes]MCG7900859.1 hypothetical protein [Candidatus Thiodiazotropha weberae]MCG7992508.1 hypothetical protein [Candidatus Thiodiazotropha lotti]MCG7999949.1 hypothetical protein [Candidatus Thiodiazotropha lotti]MCW4184166.1 hypothetical protein [Candidatus Thiodiazotropha weberae]MCW4191718.1 hypothetical protein [Candidatus Thiodiazotropha weberae]
MYGFRAALNVHRFRVAENHASLDRITPGALSTTYSIPSDALPNQGG